MKTTGYVAGILLLLCAGCAKQPLSYTVLTEKNVLLTSEVWKQGEASFHYTDIYVTDQYYAFTCHKSDTLIQVFAKNDPANCIGILVKDEKRRHAYPIDFVKSNTRNDADNDDIWVVENKRDLKQLRLLNNSLSAVKTIFLGVATEESTSYNFTKEEVYGVPTSGSLDKAFYFFQPDSGYYWVEMYGATNKVKKHYHKNPYAALSTLVVNENKNAIVCGFLFFNQIQFFDLRGDIVRSVTIGEGTVMPANNNVGSLDYPKSTKCVLDVCGTDNYVYCLYDGTKEFEKTSLILVFKWDGTHVKTYQTDQMLKKIAFDQSKNKLVALVSNENGGRDVVLYPIH